MSGVAARAVGVAGPDVVISAITASAHANAPRLASRPGLTLMANPLRTTLPSAAIRVQRQTSPATGTNVVGVHRGAGFPRSGAR